MQNPGRSRRVALTQPSQGRHRPRPWLARTSEWIKWDERKILKTAAEGCEWKSLTLLKSSYIILQHYLLLSRNLVYTGLTRAKQLAILVGPTKAIGISIKRVTDRQRYTALAERLRSTSTSSAG